MARNGNKALRFHNTGTRVEVRGFYRRTASEQMVKTNTYGLTTYDNESKINTIVTLK